MVNQRSYYESLSKSPFKDRASIGKEWLDRDNKRIKQSKENAAYSAAKTRAENKKRAELQAKQKTGWQKRMDEDRKIRSGRRKTAIESKWRTATHYKGKHEEKRTSHDSRGHNLMYGQHDGDRGRRIAWGRGR